MLTDTSPETEKVLNDLLRQAPVWRKLEMMSQLNQTAKQLVLAGLKEQYPNADAACLHRHLADRLLGSELAEKVFGPHFLETAI
ncbi:MAG: hypothetical protein IT327_20800 [Anaerolineae bacterium]|jgi:hypothetical protein|nr:hypothetical protein [Anaerolineae bacterium]